MTKKMTFIALLCLTLVFVAACKPEPPPPPPAPPPPPEPTPEEYHQQLRSMMATCSCRVYRRRMMP